MSTPSNVLPGGREPFLAFASDDATLDVLQSATSQLGWRTDACKKGGLRAAVQALSVAASPAMLLVDLSDSADPLDDIDSLAEVCEPGTLVFAIGRTNDVALYRNLVARGIHDYLVKPLTGAQLLEALERARKAVSGPRDKPGEADNQHVAIGVVGARGGAGASMVATSLAWLLATEHARSTALLDLDVHFGTGALTLDLEPGRGLTDAIDDPGRIDGLFIERAMVRAGDRLGVMSAEAPLSAGFMTDGSAFVRLEQEFRQSYDSTVVDLPRSIMLNFPQLLSELTTIVVVGELTLACARDTIRILSWCKANAAATRILVAANKVQPGPAEISPADFATAIERQVDFSIPYDYKAAVQAARLGQPFAQANRTSRSVAPLADLANQALDPAAATQPGEAGAVTGSRSLLGMFDLKSLLPKKAAGAPAGPA